MNEETQKILTELLQKTVNGIDAASSFSQAQIPEVINQLLVWNAVSSLLGQLLCLTVLIFYWHYAIKGYKYLKSDACTWEQSTSIEIGLVVGTCCAAGFLIGFFQSFDWLKIWLAPKLYLLEYGAHLIK